MHVSVCVHFQSLVKAFYITLVVKYSIWKCTSAHKHTDRHIHTYRHIHAYTNAYTHTFTQSNEHTCIFTSLIQILTFCNNTSICTVGVTDSGNSSHH